MPDDIMRFYPKMIELAAAMNCRLQHSREDVTILRGLCPFHQAARLHDSKTLRIDVKSGRFRCEYCGKSGTPLAFAAITWGVNSQDAHHLLEHHFQAQATPQRPPYPANMNELTRNNDDHPWINSAVLTRAALFYHENIYQSYPALRTLAKLAINPRKAEAAGIGYCTGAGLREFLLEPGDIAEAELKNSPLWRDNGAETLAGRLTLTDRDHTGGALWMTSIDPETDEHGFDWPKERPFNFGLRGAKPFLFGQYSITRRTPWICITDDPRLYIIAAAYQWPAVYITQRRRPEDNVADRCRRIISALANRGAANAAICMHDLTAAGAMAGMLRQQNEAATIIVHDRDSFLKHLKPDTRALELLKSEPQTSANLRPRRSARTPERDPAAEAQPSPPETGADAGDPTPDTNAPPEPAPTGANHPDAADAEGD